MLKKIFLLLLLGMNINSLVLAEPTKLSIDIEELDKIAAENGESSKFSELVQKSLEQAEERERARKREGYRTAIIIGLVAAFFILYPISRRRKFIK